MVTVGAGLAVDVGLIVGLAAGAGLSAVPLLPQVTETSSPLVTADRVASVTTGAETMVSESSLLRSPSPSAFARVSGAAGAVICQRRGTPLPILKICRDT